MYLWAKTVHKIGIEEVRKVKGYHDEPLKGERCGQRAIKLNRSYRAIYEQIDNDELILISVVEVSKHDY